MSVFDIVLAPNRTLTQVATPVTVFDAELDRVLDDMVETMRVAKGVGLAATQVGILQRFFVLEFEGTLLKIVNPEIVQFSGDEVGEEACLSLPGVYLLVHRATRVVMTFQTPAGVKRKKVFRGFMARIVQHELDHLNGVLITDRSSEVSYE